MSDEDSVADPAAVRRGYDDLETVYLDDRSASATETALVDRCCRSLPDEPTLLDVGCGPGRPVLQRLAEHGNAVGLDLSREQLRLARDHAAAAALTQGEMTRLPVATDTVDVVVAFHSLIHVPLTAQAAAIEAFARVLAPGGRVLLSDGPEEWVGRNPDWLDAGVEMQWEIAGEKRTCEQLRTAGFIVDDVVDAGHTLGDEDEHWVYILATLDADTRATANGSPTADGEHR